jgi:shikimate kinase
LLHKTVGGCVKIFKEKNMNDSIILIGMPGSGKSTVGVQLAKHLGLEFIDTDLLIQTNQGRLLQDIVDTDGHEILRHIEAQELQQLTIHKALVATGGSAVYSDSGMQNLKAQGIVIYLDVSFAEIESRITNSNNSRGIAKAKGQTLEDLYNERIPLYKKYADITINNNNHLQMDALSEAINRFKNRPQ